MSRPIGVIKALRSGNCSKCWTTDAVIAWLDNGQPDPEESADRIRAAIHGISAGADPQGVDVSRP